MSKKIEINDLEDKYHQNNNQDTFFSSSRNRFSYLSKISFIFYFIVLLQFNFLIYLVYIYHDQSLQMNELTSLYKNQESSIEKSLVEYNYLYEEYLKTTESNEKLEKKKVELMQKINSNNAEILSLKQIELQQKKQLEEKVESIIISPIISNISSQTSFSKFAYKPIPSPEPNIIKSWRNRKIDWHDLIREPKTPAERRTEESDKLDLMLLIQEEKKMGKFLTGASLRENNYGPLAVYEGCSFFNDVCMIHNTMTECISDGSKIIYF